PGPAGISRSHAGAGREARDRRHRQRRETSLARLGRRARRAASARAAMAARSRYACGGGGLRGSGPRPWRRRSALCEAAEKGAEVGDELDETAARMWDSRDSGGLFDLGPRKSGRRLLDIDLAPPFRVDLAVDR